jgi:hypothetical protein
MDGLGISFTGSNTGERIGAVSSGSECTPPGSVFVFTHTTYMSLRFRSFKFVLE